MTKVRGEELADILVEHCTWLRSEGGVRADFSNIDLSSADMRRAILRDADLRGADLTGAILRAADLSDALVSNADLRRADLKEADFSCAVVTNADLRCADFRGACLADARSTIAVSQERLDWSTSAGAATATSSTLPNSVMVCGSRPVAVGST